jgi:hypothetical protein
MKGSDFADVGEIVRSKSAQGCRQGKRSENDQLGSGNEGRFGLRNLQAGTGRRASALGMPWIFIVGGFRILEILAGRGRRHHRVDVHHGSCFALRLDQTLSNSAFVMENCEFKTWFCENVTSVLKNVLYGVFDANRYSARWKKSIGTIPLPFTELKTGSTNKDHKYVLGNVVK